MNILLIDDSEPDRELVRLCLRELDPQIRITELPDATELLRMLASARFDCVLLDYRLPDEDGIEVLDRINDAGLTEVPPVVMLTGTSDTRTVVTAMQKGAADYVLKDGLDSVFLWRTIQCAVERHRLEKKNQAYRRQVHFLALYDPLTLVGNRSLFINRIDQLLACSRREPRDFAVLAADLHEFRKINDRHGRSAGDAVLTESGRRLQSCLRSADTIFRIGSDEFAVILETGDHSQGTGEVVRAVDHALHTPLRFGDRNIPIAADIVTVKLPEDAGSVDELLATIDNKLQAAKSRRLARPPISELNPGNLTLQ